jgi:hypothetical protein
VFAPSFEILMTTIADFFDEYLGEAGSVAGNLK